MPAHSCRIHEGLEPAGPGERPSAGRREVRKEQRALKAIFSLFLGVFDLSTPRIPLRSGPSGMSLGVELWGTRAGGSLELERDT